MWWKGCVFVKNKKSHFMFVRVNKANRVQVGEGLNKKSPFMFRFLCYKKRFGDRRVTELSCC